MELRDATAIIPDRLDALKQSQTGSDLHGRIMVVDSSPQIWLHNLVEIWQQVSGRFLLHLKLTENGLSVLRSLVIMFAARIRGAWIIWEIQTELEPLIESGWGAVMRKVASLSDLVLVTSTVRNTLLGSIGIESKIINIPAVRWQGSPRKFVKPIPIMLSIAPLVRESNHAATLRAFKLIKQKYPRAELRIIGAGPLGEELEQFIDSQWLSSVTILDSVENDVVSLAFSECDLYVDSSCGEALPQWTLTALAAGLPVVKARINGSTERVHDRENGLLYALNNHSDLADCVIELVENETLAQSISRRAAASVTAANPAETKDFWQRIYSSV